MLEVLVEVEAALEKRRLEQCSSYGAARHVTVLTALIAEARRSNAGLDRGVPAVTQAQRLRLVDAAPAGMPSRAEDLGSEALAREGRNSAEERAAAKARLRMVA